MAPGYYFASRCKVGLIAVSPDVRIRWTISPAAENSWPAPLQPGLAAGKSPLGKAACAALFRLRHVSPAHKSRSSFRRRAVEPK
jgi:hypothetical protein